MVAKTERKAGKTFLVLAILILGPICICGLVYFSIFSDSGREQQSVYFAILALVSLAFYQITTISIPLLAKVSLYEDRIEVTGILQKKPKVFQLNQIDGYKKRFVPGRNKADKTLLIMLDGKRVVEISGSFIHSVDGFEQTLQEKIKYLGTQPYNILTDIRDRMLWR